MKSSSFILKLEPINLHVFKFLLEGADHLASLTVIDSKRGLVKVSFYPKNLDLINDFLEKIGKLIKIEKIEELN